MLLTQQSATIDLEQVISVSPTYLITHEWYDNNQSTYDFNKH